MELGLSSLKDRLPWDTAETSPIICPSEAETMGKSMERISWPDRKIFKRDENTAHFLKALFQVCIPLDTAVNVAVFPRKDIAFTSVWCLMLY